MKTIPWERLFKKKTTNKQTSMNEHKEALYRLLYLKYEYLKRKRYVCLRIFGFAKFFIPLISISNVSRNNWSFDNKLYVAIVNIVYVFYVVDMYTVLLFNIFYQIINAV